MCGRYQLTSAVEAMSRLFRFAERPNLTPRWNVCPGQACPVVIAGPNGPALALMNWGLHPAWMRTAPNAPGQSGRAMINARAETAHEKPSFRSALKSRRALIPADAYYEWREEALGPKTPFAIHRSDGQMLALAGLWELWSGPDGGDSWQSFCLMTISPNAEAEQIHDRMPVLIEPDDHSAWLSPQTPAADVLSLLCTAPDGTLTTTEVSPILNRAGQDGPEFAARLYATG